MADDKKSVFVTGAASGTGFAIAERFAKEGYDVFIGSRELEEARASAKILAEKYQISAYGYKMNAYNETYNIQIFDEIRQKGYLLDCLVLNAANLGIGQNTLTVDIDEFTDVIMVNIKWNFILARQAALQMKEKGNGSIIFINSNSAYRATPDRVAYISSKSGLLGMARALALEWGKYGIRVNSVLPGMIKTIRWQNNYNNCRKSLANFTPLGDIAEFADVANAVWYFGSDESKNTTGAELVVDGGNMIQLYPILPDGILNLEDK